MYNIYYKLYNIYFINIYKVYIFHLINIYIWTYKYINIFRYIIYYCATKCTCVCVYTVQHSTTMKKARGGYVESRGWKGRHVAWLWYFWPSTSNASLPALPSSPLPQLPSFPFLPYSFVFFLSKVQRQGLVRTAWHMCMFVNHTMSYGTRAVCRRGNPLSADADKWDGG